MSRKRVTGRCAPGTSPARPLLGGLVPGAAQVASQGRNRDDLLCWSPRQGALRHRAPRGWSRQACLPHLRPTPRLRPEPQRTPEQTAELLRLAHECEGPRPRGALRERAVVINRGVAEAVALRYRNRGCPRRTCTRSPSRDSPRPSAASDPSLRNDLLSHAVPTIRGELQRYFRDQGWTVRPPRRIQETQWRINQAVDQLGHRLGREPEPRRSPTRSGPGRGVPRGRGGVRVSSLPLDQPVGGEASASVGDLLPDETMRPTRARPG